MRTPSSSSVTTDVLVRGLKLVLEIQEGVLAMAERIDSLLQFGSSRREIPFVHERVSSVVEKAIAA
jgi:hypothetical protein